LTSSSNANTSQHSCSTRQNPWRHLPNENLQVYRPANQEETLKPFNWGKKEGGSFSSIQIYILNGSKNDYIQWSIDHSYANNDPSERTVDIINKRLSVIQFAAIQSSAITLANLALDLAAAPLIGNYLSIIRDEVMTELQAEGGQWTKASLARMVSLDSTLRESMRLWGFVSRGVMKEVVAKDGVTLPSGLHLACGTKVGVHATPVHRDEDIYTDALQFKPFRFCTTLAEERPKDDYSEKVIGNSKNKGTSLVTTSSNFMAFSHGRHCW
jgi:hypothetical protein